jgi:hypothetical protein
MTAFVLMTFLGVAPAVDGADGPSRELAAPVRIEAAGRPIDTAVGHAAPFVGDFDGDTVGDLLVGQFGDGILTRQGQQEIAGDESKDAGTSVAASGRV